LAHIQIPVIAGCCFEVFRIPELVEGLPSFFSGFAEEDKQPFDKLNDAGI
jgi:hypothetical protein